MSSPLKFATVVALISLAAAAHAQVETGNSFPPLAEAGLTGGTVPATQGKVVLVDFWASWCAPCRASFPAYARIQADYAPKGLVIVAVSVDDKQVDYDKFVSKFAPPFATLWDGSKKLVSEVQVPGMPTSYLVGRDGKVRSLHEGFHTGETEKELRTQIDALLAEKS